MANLHRIDPGLTMIQNAAKWGRTDAEAGLDPVAARQFSSRLTQPEARTSYLNSFNATKRRLDELEAEQAYATKALAELHGVTEA